MQSGDDATAEAFMREHDLEALPVINNPEKHTAATYGVKVTPTFLFSAPGGDCRLYHRADQPVGRSRPSWVGEVLFDLGDGI